MCPPMLQGVVCLRCWPSRSLANKCVPQLCPTGSKDTRPARWGRTCSSSKLNCQRLDCKRPVPMLMALVVLDISSRHLCQPLIVHWCHSRRIAEADCMGAGRAKSWPAAAAGTPAHSACSHAAERSWPALLVLASSAYRHVKTSCCAHGRLQSTSGLSCRAASQQQHAKLPADRYWECLAPPAAARPEHHPHELHVRCQLPLVQFEGQADSAFSPIPSTTGLAIFTFPAIFMQWAHNTMGQHLRPLTTLHKVARVTFITICLWWALATVQITGAVAPVRMLDTPPPPAAHNDVI